LCKTWQTNFNGTGVRVNAICPGLIETGMTKTIFEGARARGNEARSVSFNPTGRYGHPEEIAAMALFLVSDEASYVTPSLSRRWWLDLDLPFVMRR